MNGKVFNARIGAWARQVNADLDALARQTAQEMAGAVVERTPVDTGFLRGSWQPSIGAPADAIAKPDPSGEIARAAVTLKAAEVKAGDRFFMLNNARYARFVEYGTSRMAGRFFVGDTVAQWRRIVGRVARSLRGRR